jgi:hypothetical protein
VTYQMTACPVTLTQHEGLASELSREAFYRMEPLPGSRSVRHAIERGRIAVANWNEAGYCIDAPDVLPAGACEADEFEDTGDGAWPCPMQMRVGRE